MRARSLTLAALCALSCRNDLPPSWKLTGLRVVAITLDPPEIMPGQTAHVRVVTVDTERRALSLRWVACPPTVAALTSGNFQCASPLAVRGEGAEFDLTAPRIPGNFTTVPVALRVAVCAGGAVTLDADGVSHCAGSDSWEATRTLNISAREHNANPGVTEVRFDDHPITLDAPPSVPVCASTARSTCEHAVQVVLADDAREAYFSGGQDGGVMTHERITTHFYVTDGTLARGQNSDPTESVTNDMTTHWTPPATPGTYSLWFVVSDGRGGVTELERQVVITP